MSELSISVFVADRPYKLSVTSNEEELVRQAAVSVNEKMKSYSESYAFKDQQDLLAMVALEFATQALVHMKDKSEQIEIITNRLKNVEGILTVPK
ncbi:MAG: cell division protein ZapA [Bacteroidales bacterium]|jgi:cell division protein ZapA|nr:cell division protein ZapA [Bacteroidales bacterium]